MITEACLEVQEEQYQRPIRATVFSIVRAHLQRAYDQNRLHELKFDHVNKDVREAFPESRFNPYHFAHYKHKFLLKMGEIKMHKGRAR